MRPVVDPVDVARKPTPAHPPQRTAVRAAELRLVLARMPGLVADAIRLCRELTGFTAVTTFRSADSDPIGLAAMTPPMHPLCASRVHAVAVDAGPCAREWQRHLQGSLRSRSPKSHVCPLGLRCTCIPIYYRGMLVGVAKCVGDGTRDSRGFSRAVRILDLAISKACQDCCVALQSCELETCRERIRRLQKIRGSMALPTMHRGAAPAGAPRAAADTACESLVDRALEHIALHHLDHGITLAAMSRELGVSEKHLTAVFTRAVGQRMHAYVAQLRIQHACGMIVLTGKSIKQVAYESGFRQVDAFRRSFHRYVGVPPTAYRRAFSRG